MKSARVGLGAIVAIIVISMFGVPTAWAISPPTLEVPTGLAIAEIKITGNEFILLQNNSATTIPDLSPYWLYAFNASDPTTPGATSSTQQLPAASLGAGQTVLLSADGGSTCGAAVTADLSVSLSDTAGFVQVNYASFSGGSLTLTPGDSVSWTSSSSSAVYNAAAASITTPTTTSAKPAFAAYRFKKTDSPATFWWQPANVDSINPCQLNVTVSGVTSPGPTNPGNQLLPSLPPPVKIISLSTSSTTTTGLPAADIGLRSPQINELLPNPASPQTDAEDEFVELYNSNSSNFDLSGFVLQTGISSVHKYTFPSGVILKPKSFTAFSLEGTGLSLTNTSGRVVLFDPLGNIISKSADYSSAKDGQAWALANSGWYWTTTATPSAENVINAPGAKTQVVGTAPRILGAASTGTASSNPSGSNGGSSSDQSAPLHPWMLAGVGALAVLYAGYEYRQDLENRLHQLRRYRAARAAVGPKPEGRGGIGTSGGLGRWKNNLRSRIGRGPKK